MVLGQAKNIVPKAAQLPACKNVSGGSFRKNGCVDYHGGEAYATSSSSKSVFNKF